MTFAYNTYVSDGANRLLPLPFGFIIKPGHVVLRLNGAMSTARTLPTSGSLLTDAAPPNGTLFEALRSIPKADAVAHVSDTSAVTGADLSLDARQALHCTRPASPAWSGLCSTST